MPEMGWFEYALLALVAALALGPAGGFALLGGGRAQEPPADAAAASDGAATGGTSGTRPSARFCTECGTDLLAGTRFCTACGVAVSQS